ncbi:MAG: Hly-III family protein [Caulobacteraceae bacterium]|nr:Hly-III family protein [Caulobacteraceae bacterium]
MNLFRLTEEYLVEHYPNRAEKVADGVVHGIGLTAATVGGLALLMFASWRHDIPLAAATGLYATCLVIMLACSTIYNLTKVSRARPVLRRLDEAGIFLMIAGSYTPFTTLRFHGSWAVSMTTLVWGLALLGVVGKLLIPKIPDKVWTLFYLSFGWVAVIALKPLVSGVGPAALILLVIGGLIYSTGALLFHLEKLPFRRAIWHGFVVCAAAMHYAAIMTGVAMAAPL